MTMSQTLQGDPEGQPGPWHFVSRTRCQDLPCCCCCRGSGTNRERLIQRLNQCFLKALAENSAAFVDVVSISPGSWAMKVKAVAVVA